MDFSSLLYFQKLFLTPHLFQHPCLFCTEKYLSIYTVTETQFKVDVINPRMEVKVDRSTNGISKWVPDMRFQLADTEIPVRVITAFHGQKPGKLDTIISNIESLSCTRERGLRNVYEASEEIDRRPYERMPILKDPALVRAAQLAVLQLGQEHQSCEDVEYVIRVFGGIYSQFKQLLMQRITARGHEQ